MEGGGPVPEVTVTEQEVQRDILRLIADLPPRQRQIIALMADGYSHGEMAEILGLTLPTIRANLYKARQKLKHLISTGHPGADELGQLRQSL